MTYTPEPWEFGQNSGRSSGPSWGVFAKNKRGVYVSLFETTCSTDEDKDNACLAAAAPDMYKALKAVVEDPCMYHHETFNLVRAAIAKAEKKS